MEKSLTFEFEEETGTGLERRRIRADFPLRLSSRIGVWGLLGGIVCSPSVAYALHLPSGLAGVLSPIGFLAGGLGIAVTSALVLHKTRGPFRLLRLGALIGLPLGVLAALRGGVALWFSRWAFGHLELLTWLTTGAFLLGLSLIILFVVGLVKGAGGSGPTESDLG